MHKQFHFSRKTRENVKQFELESANVLSSAKELLMRNKIQANDIETDLKQGLRVKVNRILSGAATTTNAKQNDFMIALTDVNVTRHILLPSGKSSRIGKTFVVKDMSGGAGSTTITIAAKEGESIDGSATKTITSNYGTVRLVSDGANWWTW